MIPQSASPDVQAAFRDIYQQIEVLRSGNIDMKQRRVIGAGQSVDKFDYVTRFELDKAKDELEAAFVATEERRSTALNNVKSIRVGAYATRGAAVAHANELFVASDRTGVSFASDGANWYYSGGTHYAAFAGRPTPDATEIGYRFVDSTADQQSEWMWSGTEWLTADYLQEVTDASTATVTTAQILRHLSTGNPAAGFGVARLAQLENASNATITAFREVVEWVTATGGSEDAKWLVQLIVGGALTSILTAFQNGNIQMGVATGLLQIGGSTSSFPAICRGVTTTNTRSRLADGSADTDHEVADEAYDATNWNASVEVPTKNAVRDKIETITGGETGALVSDAAFGAGWNGVTGIAPSKNAVYDELVTKVNGTGVNFGPAAVASITVVNGVITAIS